MNICLVPSSDLPKTVFLFRIGFLMCLSIKVQNDTFPSSYIPLKFEFMLSSYYVAYIPSVDMM